METARSMVTDNSLRQRTDVISLACIGCRLRWSCQRCTERNIVSDLDNQLLQHPRRLYRVSFTRSLGSCLLGLQEKAFRLPEVQRRGCWTVE
jgi:hypothetical protein